MGRVVHFEIPIDRPERAEAFYRDALGWKVERWGPVEYWNLTASGEPGPGADGALTPRSEAPEGVLVYVGVDDIDGATDRVRDAGGTVVTAKMPIPSIGWAARVRDTEGNLIGLFQPDATAPGPAGDIGG
jgi:predicted enzyme related to lactoylglutathione lyase